MPNIYRWVSDYDHPYAAINTNGEDWLPCRKIDLYRCIVTVGTPSFLSWDAIRRFGLVRTLYDSVIEKVGIVATNIQSDMHGIRRHPIFENHIKDKKGIVSYNLGMAFAKFYSEQLLQISNLIHVEYLKKQGAINFAIPPGGGPSQEPDLVGQAPDGTWHVFEAKAVSGRTSQLTAKIREGKEQAEQVATIHGVAPATLSVCATHIGADRIFSRIVDPEKKGEKSINVDRETFLKSYYSVFSLLEQSPDLHVREEVLDGIALDTIDIKTTQKRIAISLESEIAQNLRQDTLEFSEPQKRRLLDYPLRSNKNYSVGLDGFVFRCLDH